MFTLCSVCSELFMLLAINPMRFLKTPHFTGEENEAWRGRATAEYQSPLNLGFSPKPMLLNTMLDAVD